MTAVPIRQLEPDDATELLGLYRHAVAEEPLAFVTSLEDELAMSLESVARRLTGAPDTVVFGAFDRRLVGMLWFAREPRRKLCHQALIWNVFVLREYRGQGVAGRLLRAAIAHARTLKGVESLWLGVSDRSPAARRLYERSGFEVWGIEPDGIRLDGESARMYYLGLRLRQREGVLHADSDTAETARRYQAVDIAGKFSLFDDLWRPRVVAEVNDYQFKVVKVEGDFVWHVHESSDEAFMVIAGELRIDFLDGAVTVGAGELYVVPRGVQHKPFAEKEAWVVVIEPRGVVNTGETRGRMTADNDVWL